MKRAVLAHEGNVYYSDTDIPERDTQDISSFI